MRTAWQTYTAEKRQSMEEISCRYKLFLNAGKTERECVAETIRLAESVGYRPLGMKELHEGDRVYVERMGKAVVFFHIGDAPLEEGLNILGAHIDSPRLDVKPKPLYEDSGLAYFDLHYYGGIKKYQWLTLPLALHGVVCLTSGEKRTIVIGEEESDPIFCVTDLLPHLAEDQLEKSAAKFIDGEGLDLLMGSIPYEDAEEAVKSNILNLLKMQYGFEEEDLLSAELEVVPAGKTRDLGLDRSMLLGYGHDDRVCAYTSLAALLAQEHLSRTACCLLIDKEEIGSVGATGAQSDFFQDALEALLQALGKSPLLAHRCLQNSVMLSSDVTAAYDPLYGSVFDKRSCAQLGAGVNFNKYVGARGKGGTNDASPEFIAQLRRILNTAEVHWQLTELGRVDVGGGGTIAGLFARHGMQVIDCGLPVLSMHSPHEVISKADLYEAWLCYQTFLKNACAVD